MTWTKNITAIMDTDDAGAQRIQYSVRDTSGVGHSVTFTLQAALAANPSIDAVTFAANIALIRAYGDGLCGFAPT